MTSQEHEIKRRSRVARIWQNRRKRWAAWKANREANWREQTHSAPSVCLGCCPEIIICTICKLSRDRWREKSCAVARHTEL